MQSTLNLRLSHTEWQLSESDKFPVHPTQWEGVSRRYKKPESLVSQWNPPTRHGFWILPGLHWTNSTLPPWSHLQTVSASTVGKFRSLERKWIEGPRRMEIYWDHALWQSLLGVSTSLRVVVYDGLSDHRKPKTSEHWVRRWSYGYWRRSEGCITEIS